MFSDQLKKFEIGIFKLNNLNLMKNIYFIHKKM